MENPQIGDIRINENGAEQVFAGPILNFWDDDDPRSQPAWRDTKKQLDKQRWTYQCSDCGRKEYTSVYSRDKTGRTVDSDEWFARIAESEHKAPITYVKECEKCLDDKYGKDED